MHPLLQSIVHRPWPLPPGPWVMKQTWHDLLFAHWPVPESMLRLLVPAQLDLDQFGGQCWVGVVPFRMSHIRRRGMPALPGLSRFPELNVRTYVTHGGKILYSSRRRKPPAEFRGNYRPKAEVRLREKGSLECWLTERYCLYTTHLGELYRGEIHHQPWPLQDADAELETNTVAAAAGITLSGAAPSLLFARRLEVLIWSLRRTD